MKTVVPFVAVLIASVALADDQEREAQTDDIREAVFRWQFEHNASGLKKKAGAYFLQIGEKRGDPTDKFLKRFADHKPPVRKASGCHGDPVRDKTTSEQGIIFSVTNIEWKSDTDVVVKGGYCEGGLSASGNTYTLKKDKGKWQVTGDRMDWIS